MLPVSLKDGNSFSSRNDVFSSFQNSGRYINSLNPVIMCVIYLTQNPFKVYSYNLDGLGIRPSFSSKVMKFTNSKCYAPSSGPFRVYWNQDNS
jgi:hypothetical protein